MTNSRRRAVITLAPEVLLDFCKTGEFHYKVESEIPNDAVLEGAQYDNTKDVWLLAFSSDSLDEISISNPLPILDPPILTRICNETSS